MYELDFQTRPNIDLFCIFDFRSLRKHPPTTLRQTWEDSHTHAATATDSSGNVLCATTCVGEFEFDEHNQILIGKILVISGAVDLSCFKYFQRGKYHPQS